MKAVLALLANFPAHNVNEELLLDIQAIYRAEVQGPVSKNRREKTTDLKRRISQLEDEEARSGRLFMIEQISE